MTHELGPIDKSHEVILQTAGEAGLGIAISQTNEDNVPTTVFCNDRLLAILGYTREEIIGRPVGECLHSEVRD